MSHQSGRGRVAITRRGNGAGWALRGLDGLLVGVHAVLPGREPPLAGEIEAALDAALGHGFGYAHSQTEQPQ